MKEFNFTYYTAKNVVTIDDQTIKAKSGPFIKHEFAAKDLQHFYNFETKDYHVLYMTYFNERMPKAKKVQLYSQDGAGDFKNLCEELKEKFPAKSLNHLPEAEAFKMMKTANPKKWAPIAVFFILSICMTIIFYPMLMHYFDKGFAEVTIEDFLANPNIGTRNISINGLLLDAGLEETTTTTHKGSTTVTKSNFIPMVDSAWAEGDPIKTVLEFGEMTSSEYDEAISQFQFTGVIRDIWWEGISSDNIDFFKTEYDLKFAGTPVLIEVTNSRHNDGYIIWVWGGSILLILILVVIVAVRMNRR